MLTTDKRKAAMRNERWAPITGCAGLYEVSDMGRIRSLVARNAKHREYLKPTLRRDGYLQVGLVAVSGCRVHGQVLVHRIVLEAFCGPAHGLQCAHLNGIKQDNRLANLRWVTCAENASHKVAHGTDGRGERNAMAVLTEDIVRALRSEYVPRSRTHGCRPLAEKYGTNFGTVWAVVSGRNWKHV